MGHYRRFTDEQHTLCANVSGLSPAGGPAAAPGASVTLADGSAYTCVKDPWAPKNAVSSGSYYPNPNPNPNFNPNPNPNSNPNPNPNPNQASPPSPGTARCRAGCTSSPTGGAWA